jgi:hypothetical protein
MRPLRETKREQPVLRTRREGHNAIFGLAGNVRCRKWQAKHDHFHRRHK